MIKPGQKRINIRIDSHRVGTLDSEEIMNSMNKLAKLGLGVRMSVTSAFFILASSYADTDAEFQSAYNQGDYKTALKLLKPFAEQGAPLAQYNLGMLYDQGHGVTQDVKQTIKWYKLAAQKGYVHSQLRLGGMYALGQGTKLNYIQAYIWFSIAELNGNEEARVNREILEKEMTPEQLSKAQ